MRYLLYWFLLMVILAGFTIAFGVHAECEIAVAQPNCWAAGDPMRVCAKAARAWDGEWDWFVNGTLATTTTEPVAMLPCPGLSAQVEVATRGGPVYKFKPIFCAAPWDTNRDSRFTSADLDRERSIFGKGCSIGRQP